MFDDEKRQKKESSHILYSPAQKKKKEIESKRERERERERERVAKASKMNPE